MSPRSRHFLNYCFCFILLLFLLFIFWDGKIVRETTHLNPFSGDLYDYYVPSYLYTSENLTRFHIPLWNPYQMCGTPCLAVLQGAVFYPPVLVFSLFPPLTAYAVYIMFHVLLGGFFILIFCRFLKLSWVASIAAAVAFMFCNNTVEKLFGPAFLASSIYLPLMLMSVVNIFETNRFRWALALAFSFLIPLFAGWVQPLIYSVYILLLFTMAFAWRSYGNNLMRPNIKRAFLLLALSALIFFLLSAIQTFPVIELGVQATRSFQRLSDEMVTINDTAFYGPYRMIFDMVNARGAYLPYYLYMGMLPLLLSVLALFNRKLRFYVLFLYMITICSLIFSLGPQTPFFGLASHLPLMSMFRAPFRILFIYAFSISVLCGIGLDLILLKVSVLKEGRKNFSLLLVLFISLASLLAFYLWPETNPLKNQIITLLSAASLWRYYLLISGLLLLLSLILPVSSKGARALIGAGCVAIIFSDLYKAPYQYYLPKWGTPLYQENQAALQKLRALTHSDNSRAFIVSDWGDFSYCLKQGQISKAPLIDDYENMNPLIYNDYVNYMFGRSGETDFFWGWFNLDDPLAHHKLLDYMSAKYVLIKRSYIETNQKHAAENYRKLKASYIPVYADAENEILLNPKALPRAYVVGKYRNECDKEKALALLASDEFAAGGEVVLSTAEKIKDQRFSCTAATVTIEKSEPEQLFISAELNGDGLLVLTDQFYPGWTATIDGKPTEIYRANYLFRCIVAPAGKHLIAFEYRPKSFLYGRILFFTGIILMVALILLRVFSMRKRRMQGATIKIAIPQPDISDSLVMVASAKKTA